MSDFNNINTLLFDLDGTLINTEKEFYMSFNEMLLNNYKIKIYEKIIENSSVPILYNINFGHAVPRCFLQYNALATVDYDNKTIKVKSCKLI